MLHILRSQLNNGYLLLRPSSCISHIFYVKVDVEIWTLCQPVCLAALVRCLCCMRSSEFLDLLGEDFRNMFSFSASVFVDVGAA